MAFDEYAYAIQFRDLIKRLVDDKIEQLRPRVQYATVTAIDRVLHKCTVNYPGDATPIPINMGVIQPSITGQTVRIDGLAGDRYIADVLGDSSLTVDVLAAESVNYIQGFTASGTWTKPAKGKFARVRLMGGGGGGSGGVGAASGQAQGAGGGGGGYVEHIFLMSALSATESVVVGTGGGGGGAGSPGAGLATTFKTLTAGGGTYAAIGVTAATSTQACSGGPGGTASGGNIINVIGGDGGPGRTILGVSTVTGNGGASFFAGASNQSFSTGVNGPAGNAYGGGGAGAWAQTVTRVGGAGANGLCLIEVW